MCGRFSQSFSLAELLERYQIESDEQIEWLVKYNVAPSLNVPTVIQGSDQRVKLLLMKWGMPLPWETHLQKYRPLTNLRTDTLRTKTVFKRLVETSRCIVPVDGFNEWTGKKPKIPYRFVMKSGNIFNLAAVYQVLVLPNNRRVHTVCLITTEANSLVEKIHDRMPVIIPEGQEALWLNPKSKWPDIDRYLHPYPGSEMRAYPVSTKINSGALDAPELIQPSAE